MSDATGHPSVANGDEQKTGHIVEKTSSHKYGQSEDAAAHSYTREEEKRVLRKLDCVILPMVCSDGIFSRSESLRVVFRCAWSFSFSILTSRVSAMLLSLD